MIDEVRPPEAWHILQQDPRAVLLDVRSRVEFDYVGHPPGAVNIPWKDPPDAPVDPDFVNKVYATLKRLNPQAEHVEDLTILALCRSGARSRTAGEVLQARGFKRVYNIAEGFEGDRNSDRHRGMINGWRVHNLPWEQS